METKNDEIRLCGVNIGSRITEKLGDIGMSKAELSRALGMNQSNLNKLLNRGSMETDKLVEISKAMKYNFFKEFCRSSDFIMEYLSDEEFYISEVNIGQLIDKRIKELGLTQKQVAEKVSQVWESFHEQFLELAKFGSVGEFGFRQQYVSTVTKRSSIDTSLLFLISCALEMNFFEFFYRKEEKTENAESLPLKYVKKVERLILENEDLRHKVNVLSHIIETCGMTYEDWEKLGYSKELLEGLGVRIDDKALSYQERVKEFLEDL